MGMINFKSSNKLFTIFWVTGFVILTFNVGFQLACGSLAIFSKPSKLKEDEPPDNPPKIAIVYVVRNEDENELFTNMDFSFSNNQSLNIDLWLLSNSDDDSFAQKEFALIKEYLL